jgi:hypothetical protein
MSDIRLEAQKIMNKEFQNITGKVKSSLQRLKRLALIALGIYVIVMIGRFVYKIFILASK